MEVLRLKRKSKGTSLYNPDIQKPQPDPSPRIPEAHLLWVASDGTSKRDAEPLSVCLKTSCNSSLPLASGQWNLSQHSHSNKTRVEKHLSRTFRVWESCTDTHMHVHSQAHTPSTTTQRTFVSYPWDLGQSLMLWRFIFTRNWKNTTFLGKDPIEDNQIPLGKFFLGGFAYAREKIILKKTDGKLFLEKHPDKVTDLATWISSVWHLRGEN